MNDKEMEAAREAAWKTHKRRVHGVVTVHERGGFETGFEYGYNARQPKPCVCCPSSEESSANRRANDNTRGIMKFTVENFEADCGCRSVGECHHNDFADTKAFEACIDAFAEEMKRKLRRKAMQGKSGWDDPNWPQADIIEQLQHHVTKGDMVDVANFAMFAWNQQ